MRDILITGGAGFIGANLVRRLSKDKDNIVHIIVREKSNLWRIKDILDYENIIKHIGDINDIESLKKIFTMIRPEIIIHTAIYGGYSREKDNEKILNTNFQGTVNLLNATKDIDYKLFINTGSSSEYGKKRSPMKESDILEPNSDYGVAKSAATLYATNFSRTYNKPIITLRLFSPYGMYEDIDRLIPYVTLSHMKNQNITIGNLNSSRDFIFIEDVMDCYETIINSDKTFYGEIFNVGSGEQHSVSEVIETISDLTDTKLEIKTNESNKRSFDTETWVADITKINQEFSWIPKTTFIEGLKRNIDWFKGNEKLYQKKTEEDPDIQRLKKNASEMRMDIAKIKEKKYSSHIGGDYSIIDILNVLYFKIMDIDPKDPEKKDRDKLILSKGHSSLALYTVLSKRGFFDESILNNYCEDGSYLEGHVNYHNVSGTDVSSGSLGHGLAIGVGMALSNKNDNNKGKIFVILGDGECNEGSIWEAAILASRLRLDNLTVIVDANKLQGFDSTDEIYGKLKLTEMWKSFGFQVKDIDGHDYKEIIETLKNIPFKTDSPNLVFANTIKGKGISFMENRLEWHYKSPNKDQLKIIEEELNNDQKPK